MKASVRSRVRLMPRAPHIHNFNTVVAFQGRHKIRYGCADCPAVDRYWYYLVDLASDVRNGFGLVSPRVAAILARRTAVEARKTSGWLSGSGGTVSNPQGPSGTFGFITTADHQDGDDTRVIDKIDVYSYGPSLTGLYPIENVTKLVPEAQVQLDPDHPHADTPDVPDYTEDQLQEMTKKTLLDIAKDLNVARRHLFDKPTLVQKILEAQKEASR